MLTWSVWQSVVSSNGTRLASIDALRATAAVSVIVIHSVTVEQLRSSWAVFHVWQAVPLFIAVMGASAYISLSGRNGIAGAPTTSAVLGQVTRRVGRLLPAFLAVWVLVLLAALMKGDAYFGIETLMLMMPIKGPGNYFVPVALQLAVASPFLFRGVSVWPMGTLVVCGFGTVGFESLASFVDLYANSPFAYDANALRYLFIFYMGMLLVHQRAQGVRVPTIGPILYAVFSAAYLVFVNLTDANGYFEDAWRWQNALSFGYASLLLALALRNTSGDFAWGGAVVRRISMASYHIFLFQMVYFTFSGVASRIEYAVINLIVCIFGGVVFYQMEKAIRCWLASKGNLKQSP